MQGNPYQNQPTEGGSGIVRAFSGSFRGQRGHGPRLRALVSWKETPHLGKNLN